MHPVSLCTFFYDRGASILMMASIFSGLASIPRWLTMNLSNFPVGTPIGTCSQSQGEPTRVNSGDNRAHALDGKSSVPLISHGHCAGVFIGT
jgi:hypothetical protein